MAVNAGSSSIKLALFAGHNSAQKVLEAFIEGIGLPSTNLVTSDGTKRIAVDNHSGAPKIRARVCDGLDFLGISLNTARNEEGARLISADDSPVGVHVIHTDEAATIAHQTAKLTQQQR